MNEDDLALRLESLRLAVGSLLDIVAELSAIAEAKGYASGEWLDTVDATIARCKEELNYE